MKKLILKPYDKIIVAILGLISFLTGCNLIGPTPAEYGVPTADYEIKGTVTDSLTSTPITQAKVTITRTETWQLENQTTTHIDTLATEKTDSNGKFDIQVQQFPLDEVTFHVNIEDVDGNANGGDFYPQNKDISFKIADLTGTKADWYSGKAAKTQDFKLKKK
ncbi:MAG: radical SAM-associated putative lipoprotein [Paludibacter sp.]